MGRSFTAIVLFAACVVAMSGCGQSATKTEAQDGAKAITVSDQWVKAADTDMTALFGTLKNSGTQAVTVVSAASPAAGMVELHEVVSQPGGGSKMQPKDGGFTIPAGGSHVLAPGGDHLMLMDLKAPLPVGTDVEVTLTFKDGSSLPFTAQVRTFPGASETYAPGGHPAGQHG